jgi:hypothetical protein
VSKRSTDVFWDKVIQAHDTVATYPEQKITVTNHDRNAHVWYSPDKDAIYIKLWEIKEQ